MHLQVERSGDLPLLSWCARWRKNDFVVRLRCGSAVEVFDRGWVEGAWAGPFDEFGFEHVPLAGSAGHLLQDELVLVPPFHTLEALHVAFANDEMLASNSLAFLLAEAHVRLTPRHTGYAMDFRRIVFGIDQHDVTIPTREGVDIHLCHFKQVVVSSDHDLTFKEPARGRPFCDYDDYFGYLSTMIESIAENARDSRRLTTYQPLTSLSSGYDSPVCAVFARQVGCTKALSLTRARGENDQPGEDDSGVAVASQLGLALASCERDTALSHDGRPSATEFWATGQGLSELIFRPFEPFLPGALFFTGFLGDTMWGLDRAPNPTLKRMNLSGSAMGEFRMRIGFIHLPVPYLSALRHSSILAISRSKEMLPWSVGGDYDRPIARRIVEEAGVRRDSFGREKKMVATIGHPDGIDDPVIRAAFSSFIESSGTTRVELMRYRVCTILFRFMYGLATSRLKVLRAVRRLPRMRENAYIHNLVTHHPEGSLPFIWACEQLMNERYATRS